VLAGEHLAATRANDLILYDRGYPAFWLLALHHQEQRRFCARMLLAFSREVSAFVASGKNSEAVLFTPGPHARQHCQTYGLATDPIPLRLIRVKLKSGEIEGLATSLLEEQTYPSTWFKHLYHLRWGVEEGYKREKCRSWVAQAIADRLYRDRQHTYRVNFAQALSKRKDNLARLFVSNSSRQLLTALILAMATSVEAVRPDRLYPRKIKPAKLHPFHPNYKRCHEP